MNTEKPICFQTFRLIFYRVLNTTNQYGLCDNRATRVPTKWCFDYTRSDDRRRISGRVLPTNVIRPRSDRFLDRPRGPTPTTTLRRAAFAVTPSHAVFVRMRLCRWKLREEKYTSRKAHTYESTNTRRKRFPRRMRECTHCGTHVGKAWWKPISHTFSIRFINTSAAKPRGAHGNGQTEWNTRRIVVKTTLPAKTKTKNTHADAWNNYSGPGSYERMLFERGDDRGTFSCQTHNSTQLS